MPYEVVPLRVDFFNGCRCHGNGQNAKKNEKPHYGEDSYKVSLSLMKGIQKCFKLLLFCFHGNCGKVCPKMKRFQ
jgi:hypothetical protein